MSLTIQGDDFNAPTNPQLTSGSSDFSDGDRVYTAIVSHGAVSVAITGFGGTVTENSNLTNTKGFRIKCYDSLTTTGVRFNPADWNATTGKFTTNDYFVLLYSDNPLQHHLAKITEVKTEDLQGDAFEFEPKLGNEIPKDTKFIIFQVTQNTDIVAISLGMKQDSSLGDSTHYQGQLARRMVVARPLFYFYDGLDKEGELDHNIKYFAMRECGTANSYTLDKTDPSRAFVTVQDFGKAVIDYSKYSHSIKLTDKLRDLDAVTSTATNEGVGYSQNTVDYDLCYKNARRIADDEINSPVYTGITRYLNYDFSPTKSNVMYNVYDHVNTESIDGKGGFAETSILDNGRIVPKKIKEFSPYRVRHNIHTADFNAFFPLKATYSSSTSAFVFSFNTEYDLGTVLNAGDEVQLGDKILIVNSFGTLSGTTQTITFQNDTSNPYARGENDGVFTAQSITPSSNEVLHRRAYNATDGTLMLDTHLLNGRFSKMYVAFTSLNHKERFAIITACDAVKNIITLSFTGDSYNSNPLSFTKGKYQLFIERFNGEIENIEAKKEEGQSIVEIKGRDKFSKLLSPIINLDTGFSEEIIYSTLSPYNTLGNIHTGSTYTVALGATTIQTGRPDSDAAFTNSPQVGDKLFTVNGYIGEITALGTYFSGATLRSFTITPSLTKVYSEIIYMETDKNYMFNKSLSSSHLTTVSPSSLKGAASKGLYFTSGNVINSNGSEGNNLVGSSISNKADAIGYHINNPVSINKDNEFQSKLADEIGSEPDSTFNTVNTLIDFEIINVDSKDNVTEIELAPYIPITLGRKMPKYENTDDASAYTLIGTTSGASVGSALNITSSATPDGSTQIWSSINIGEPLFSLVSGNYTFIGIVRKLVSSRVHNGANVMGIIFDRDIVVASSSVYKISENIQELGFINGKHLAGGKIVSIPHPKVLSTGLVPLNHKNPHNTNEDTNKKFGQPFYKLNSLAVGNFNYPNIVATKSYGAGRMAAQNTYVGKNSLINYLGEVYQFKPKTGSSNVTIRGKTNTGDKHWPYDERGQVDVYGSIYCDTIFYDTHVNNQLSVYTTYDLPFQKQSIKNIDNSFHRLFMYINSDILPYSSLRAESIYNSTKEITNYNLFLLENKSIGDNSLVDKSGKRTKLQNLNFQTVGINSSDFSNSGKRCGMMRLTELCIDFVYNSFNPEKPNSPNLDDDSSVYTSIIYAMANTNASAITINVSSTVSAHSSNPKQIVFNGSITLANGTEVTDSRGNRIGIISNGGSVTGTTHTFAADMIYTTTDSWIPTGLIYFSVPANLDFYLPQTSHRGEYFIGKKRVQNTNFKHKGVIIPKGEDAGGQDDRSYWGVTQGKAFTSSGAYGDGADVGIHADSEVVLPYSFQQQGDADITANAYTSVDCRAFQSFSNIDNKGYEGLMAVALDRYDVEDGGRYKLEKGQVSDLLGIVRHFGIRENSGGSPNHEHFFTITTTGTHFKSLEDVSETVPPSSGSHTDSIPFAVDGIILGMKLRLWFDSDSRTNASGSAGQEDILSSNGNFKKHVMDVSDKNRFLKYVDLTGCYLVQESNGTTHGTETTVVGMNEVLTEDIIYVVSHEIDDSTQDNHILITDKAIANDRAYRIMQPNEVCMYDFSPEDISFNKMSSRYTKVMNSNEVYNIKSSYFHKDTSDDITKKEAFLSMYVLVDTDKQTSDDYMVIRNKNNIHTGLFPEGNYNLFVSDGDNKGKVVLNVEKQQSVNNRYSSSISKPFFCKGLVSLSETFTIKTNTKLTINPSRAYIGTTATLGYEGEDLINELFEQEGITYQTTTTDTPVYLAPNYQGVDLYSAIRYILQRKEMKLVEENDVFRITPKASSDYYTNITINDSGDYLISEFEKETTLFDFYNEIIVYGISHKAVRKDIRSINKRGRKTLEVLDSTLLTQEEVDKHAIELLVIHSRFNQKISFTMQNKGINQLRVGDIVSVAMPRENIEMSEYIVLEMQHSLTGFIKLQLGRYTKNLEDIFSELLISNKLTKTALRSNNLSSNEISYNLIDTLTTKELKLLIRKRDASGASRTLGFSTQLGFSTNSQLGFSGGAITITDLLEEDLT